MRKKLFFLLLVIFFIHLFLVVYSYKGEYFSRYDQKYWEERYLRSQWVVPNSKEPIGDDGLFAYEGWEYIHGSDPTMLNAEVPPVGKYLIGLSEVLFDNQNIFALLSGIYVLIAFFLLNKIIFKDNLLAFLPVFLLSFDELFYTQLRAPFLDLLYLGLLLTTFIFFLKGKYVWTAIFLGLMVGTKSSISTFFLVSGVMCFYLLSMKHIKELKRFVLHLPIAIGVLLLTYSVYFFKGHTIIGFLGVQKWIFNFYATGAKGDPSAALQILFSGTWVNWFGPPQRVEEWSIFWLLALLGVLYYLYLVFSKRIKHQSVLFGIWVIAYLIFLAVVPVWPRYLLLLLPFLYNLSIWALSQSLNGKLSSRFPS